MTLSVTTDFSAGTAIVASEVNQNFTDVETYINSSPGLLAKTGGTLSGALVVGGDLTVDTTTLKVDASNDVVGIGTATPSSSYKLDISGNTRTTGTTTLIGALTVGVNDTGHDVKFFAAADGDYFEYSQTLGNVVIETPSTGANEVQHDTANTGILRIGESAGEHLAIDGNEIMAKSNGTTAGDLHFQNNGGTVKFGNSNDLTLFEVKGPATFSGSVTIDSVGIAAVQTGSEPFADNDTSLMTSAAVQDKILSYGYAKVTIASSAPSAGGAGEIWIDTSS
jgi:hypothetical protein